MSHIERNLKFLNDRRIVYRRKPITDIPTIENEVYMFYENGTYECYELFRSSAKITTYKSLKWHMLVLWYLNPQLDQDDFMRLAEIITYKPNGFVSFAIHAELLRKIVYEVSMLDLNDMGKRITINRIAGLLDCSSRTIHRNMCEELKREKELLNQQL